jgi:glycine dehydrogenase subunit 1
MTHPTPRAHPYMSNSAPDVKAELLAGTGATDVEELFEQIPADHRLARPLDLPRQLSSEI